MKLKRLNISLMGKNGRFFGGRVPAILNYIQEASKEGPPRGGEMAGARLMTRSSRSLACQLCLINTWRLQCHSRASERQRPCSTLKGNLHQEGARSQNPDRDRRRTWTPGSAVPTELDL